MSRVVFRVDASSTIGVGHLSRSLLLAGQFRDAGFQTVVASRAPSAHTRGWVEREGHTLLTVDSEDPDASCRAARDAVLVVVDGYTFGVELHDALREDARLVCVVDDVADAVLHADVVLNGNLFGTDLAGAYAAMGVGAALLGPQFALVRDEFARARDEQVVSGRDGDRPTRSRVLVTMGGADPSRMTERYLEAAMLLDEVEICVVVGGANPRAPAIRDAARAASSSARPIEVLFDVPRMSELMQRCDVAVAAAGSTCLELATIGVPALIVPVADNQLPVAAAFARYGLMQSLGGVDEATPEALADATRELLRDPDRRAQMAERQRATVDGQGASRAVGELQRRMQQHGR